jgi:Holliday junction resolvase RusA-like endonuclease
VIRERVEILVPEVPAGKNRPRFDGRTRRTYTDDATVAREDAVIRAWRAAGSVRLPDGPLALFVDGVVARPVDHFLKGGALNAKGAATPHPHMRKPDVDNAVKLVMDALNRRAYSDDVQIVHALLNRRWATAGEEPHTRIVVGVVDDVPQAAAA